MTHRIFGIVAGRTHRRFAAVGVAIGLTLVGCASDASTDRTEVAGEATAVAEVSITLARAQRPDIDQTSAPVYGILANNTDSAIRVVSATSPMAARVEMQRPVASDPNELVAAAGGFVIEVEGGVVMEPHGFQLTLIDIDPSAFGDSISVTLRLDNGDDFTFTAEVLDTTN